MTHAMPLTPTTPSSFFRGGLLALFFLSGLTGLVYQVLWLRELGLLFGNTAYATATTLAVFFSGLALGNYAWGEKAAQLVNPLRAYAWLELGIGGAALLALLLTPIYRWLYPFLFETVGHHHVAFILVRALLATTLLLPSTFCMGGTLPIVGHFLIRQQEKLGHTVSVLYAANTLGAALGAALAGFYLPLRLGFRSTYVLTMATNALLAVIALWLSKRAAQASISSLLSAIDNQASSNKSAPSPALISPALLRTLALASGFITLGLEVLWTRMFAQVLHNSTYSFSTILIVFLLALAGGALLAHGLCRLSTRPEAVLSVVLTAAGCFVGSSPLVFYFLTNGLGYLTAKAGWSAYLETLFTHAAFVLFPPVLLMGCLFPYLLKLHPVAAMSVGQIIGRLTALNTLGAILGSLSAGFLLLDALGLWTSIKLMAVGYFLLALFVASSVPQRRLSLQAAPALGLLLFVSLLDPSHLPALKFNPKTDNIYAVWESHHGVVAVVKRENNLRIKVDNSYVLGGVAGAEYEQRQAQLPLSIHPNPKSVFLLGMGTGITAGAALDFPMHEVVTCELIPEVVLAAREFFHEHTNGLFTDPRSRIIIADGRNYLQGTQDTYDVIISDLFIPWHAGTGNLYTQEHFSTVFSRLAPGGLFAQWTPLYQLSKQEFFIIAKTMLTVFPQVTLWRGDFLSDKPIVALVGHRAPLPFPIEHLRSSSKKGQQLREAVTGLLYAGNLSTQHGLFDDVPVNTDDRPWIEYLAPITQQQQAAQAATWFTALDLVSFYDTLFATIPPERDPFLQKLNPEEVGYVHAGLSFYKAHVYRDAKQPQEAQRFLEDYLARVPAELHPQTHK